LLVRDLLSRPTAREVADVAATALEGGAYAGCNLLCADSQSAWVIHAADWLRVRPLPPGIHVLTARDVNDEADGRIAFSLWWLAERALENVGQAVVALEELCARRDHAGEPDICLKGSDGGTVSSSVVVLGPLLSRARFLHAQGPPDSTPFADYSYLLEELAATQVNGG
jgi:hypothetical protein